MAPILRPCFFLIMKLGTLDSAGEFIRCLFSYASNYYPNNFEYACSKQVLFAQHTLTKRRVPEILVKNNKKTDSTGHIFHEIQEVCCHDTRITDMYSMRNDFSFSLSLSLTRFYVNLFLLFVISYLKRDSHIYDKHKRSWNRKNCLSKK